MKKRLTEYSRSLLVAAGWGTCVGGVALWAVFQGVLLPATASLAAPEGLVSVEEIVAIFYIVLVGVSIMSGLIIANFARSLGVGVVSYFLGAFIVFEVLSAPGLSTSTLNNLKLFITRNELTNAAIDVTFRIMFPFPVFAMLVGAILGTALGEHYF